MKQIDKLLLGMIFVGGAVTIAYIFMRPSAANSYLDSKQAYLDGVRSTYPGEVFSEKDFTGRDVVGTVVDNNPYIIYS